jgi:hypothetical protein
VIVALVGVTIIVVRGRIFSWLQGLYRPLFGCSLCVGWWVGALWSLARHASTLSHVCCAVLDGATVALAALLVDAVLLRLLGDPDDAQ